MQIKLLLTDLDGTLVDTKEANYLAYQEVLKQYGYELKSEKYSSLFGLRILEFMKQIGITDLKIIEQIKLAKKKVYPNYFNHLKLNKSLFNFLSCYKESGCKTGLISTAQQHNIINVLEHFNISDSFDIIVSGNDISNAKPDPYAYLYAMEQLGFEAKETLIFEDSKTGIEAAQNAGSAYIQINNAFFEHRS